MRKIARDERRAEAASRIMRRGSCSGGRSWKRSTRCWFHPKRRWIAQWEKGVAAQQRDPWVIRSGRACPLDHELWELDALQERAWDEVERMREPEEEDGFWERRSWECDCCWDFVWVAYRDLNEFGMTEWESWRWERSWLQESDDESTEVGEGLDREVLVKRTCIDQLDDGFTWKDWGDLYADRANEDAFKTAQPEGYDWTQEDVLWENMG